MRFSHLTLLAFLTLVTVSSFAPDKQYAQRLGIMSGLGQDSIAHAGGFTMIGESVRKMLAPGLSDEDFNANLKQMKAARCKVTVCNLFFPGNIKIAGPDVVESKVLSYADSVLNRAGQAGVKLIVLGSGGSRNIPAGYDLAKAQTDFVALCKKIGQLGAKHKVIIALENLETTETTFITSLKSAAEIVRRVNHPNFRLNVDIFHMMREGESPDEIRAAKGLVGYCEVAEKEKRTLPGVMGDDFKPYFRALRDINYKGLIFIEGSIGNAALEIPAAYKYLSAQLAEVDAEKG